MRQLTTWKEQKLQEQVKRTAELNAVLQAKQEHFQYAREIKKRMESCEKVFREQRMEGYDFREIDLQNAVFLNCSLRNSNFAGVSLENAFFVNCDLSGCIWYGAMLGNCIVYGKGEALYLSERIRTTVV